MSLLQQKERGEVMAGAVGHNGYIEPAQWAWTCAQSKAHAHIKLIVHTLRCLVQAGEQEVFVTDARLAELTSLEIKTVRKYRKATNDEGWAKHTSGIGRGKPSSYQLGIPVQTLLELDAKIQAAKTTQGKGTFRNPPLEGKVPKGRVSLEGKVPVRNLPLEDTREREGYFLEGTFKKEIPPTPPKEKNNNITTLRAREDNVENKMHNHTARVAAGILAAGLAGGGAALPAAANTSEPLAIAQELAVKLSSSELSNKLLDAGGEAMANPANSPGLIMMSEPQRWIENGCDLELDILPTIKARAYKMRPGSIRSWSYFTQAVADAKAAREQPMPQGNAKNYAPRNGREPRLDVEALKEKPPGMADIIWQKIQEGREKAKANGGVAALW